MSQTQTTPAQGHADPRVPPRERCVVRYLIDRWAAEKADQAYVIFDASQQWTYRELRDKVVSQLASTTLDELTAPGGRDSLRTRLVVTIKSVLDKEDQESEIKVFLPQFVIQ